MSTVKAITLRATYEGNLTGLKSDIATLKSVRRQLEGTPVKIPIRLDLTGIRSDATKAAMEYQKAFTAAMSSMKVPSGSAAASSGTSAGGIALPTGISGLRAAVGQEIKLVQRDIDNGKVKVVQSYQQLASGIQQVITDTERKTKRGVVKSREVKQVDTTPTENLKRMLDQIQRDYGSKIGAAKGTKGDVASVLAEQRARLEAEISKFSGLAGTSEYRRYEKLRDSIDARQAQAVPTQARAIDKATQTARATSLKDAIAAIDRGTAGALGTAKGDKGDVASVLASKRQQIQQALSNFSDIPNSTAYKNAQKAITTLDKQIAQAVPTQARAAATANRRDYDFRTDRVIKRGDRSLQSSLKDNKAEESTANAIQNRAARESELNRIMDERERLIARQQARFERLSQNAKASGNYKASARFDTAAMRVGNELGQVRLDRTHGTNEAATKADTQALERRLSAATQAHKMDRQQLSIEESLAKAAKSRIQREERLNEVMQKRQTLQRRTQNEISDIHFEASKRGNHGLAQSAAAAGSGVARQGEADLHRLTQATKSARAGFSMLDNSLLKNAATFTQWYIPAQAMMGFFNVLGNGMQRAIAADRAFKTLNVVFKGTREEASLLADQTIMLAAANGRSTTEAAESAVAWARVTSTRSQALLGVETSLRAANVAEVSAGEVTNYLIAIYKGYNLTMEQTAGMLDYVNALSNRYSVTNKNLFEGIARSASIAKSAGLSFGELAGIITTVSANTGRPGAEIGNSVKSIINRVRRPETMAALKTDFGLDLKDSAGDVKTMSEILAQLAAIYPNLNREQKAHLGNLVAGSLQANRFTVIMENYTDSLIAQAKAGFDTNSAMRENSEILNSVDAQIQRVTTSWDQMLISFGKAGGFDAASSMLRMLGNRLQSLSESDKPSPDAPKPTIRVDDANTRDALSVVLGQKKLFRGGKADYTPAEIEEAARRMDEADRLGNTYGKSNLYNSKTGRGPINPGRVSGKKFYSPENPLSLLPSDSMQLQQGETFGSVAKAFLALIPQQEFKDSAAKLTATTKEILDDQKKAGGFGAGANAFNAMARDLGAKNVDMTKLTRQFDDSLEIVEKLPNGMQAAAEARAQIRPMLESGNKSRAAAGLTAIGMDLSKAQQSTFLSVEERRQKALAETKELVHQTSAEIDKLWQERRNAPAEQQDELNKKIEKTNVALKDQQEKLNTLSTATQKIEKESLSDNQKARLDAYSADVKQQGEIMGQTISGFGNTGFSDLDTKLKIGAGMIQGNLLRESLGLAQAQNAGEGDGIRDQIKRLDKNAGDWDITAGRQRSIGAEKEALVTEKEAQAMRIKAEQLRQELSMRDAIEGKLADEIAAIEKATAEAERKLEIERQAAKLREAYNDGGALSAARGAQYAVGRTQGEQLINSERGAITDIDNLITDRNFGKGSAEQSAAQLGALTERLTAGKQGLVSIEQRLASATAERANLELEIADAQKKQTLEASKRLMLASREDQLRAAGLAAALRSRGKDTFSAQEFQFFSQGTRSAAANFAPQSVRELDDTGRDAAERRSKLDNEISQLAISLKDLRQSFQTIKEAAEAKGGQLAGAMAPNGATNANEIPKLDKAQVNLSLGGVTINLDLANQFNNLRQVLEQGVNARLDEAFRRMSQGSGAPNTAAAAGVF